MAITAGKLMHTMMHPEMLFVAHVHQSGVASPAVRVDDAAEGYLARIAACGCFLAATGAISV